MKRYISFALVMVMIFVLFAVMPNTALTVSDTNNNFLALVEPISDGVAVVYISTPEELAAIGGWQSAGKYYALSNDIDLVDEWAPIDNFQGTFDGQGYSTLMISSGVDVRR